MTKTKIRKKPRTKQNLRHAKKRLAKVIKVMRKKSNIIKNVSITESDSDFVGIIKKPSGLRTYDLNNSRFNGVHPDFITLNEFEWLGLLTLKFHSYSHSNDDHNGHKNRLDFAKEFMDNLRIKLGISDRELNWIACEEFGFTGTGHLHVLFSFDYLKEKNRMDKIKISDFSESGEFFQAGMESVIFVSQELKLDPRSVDFHWRPMWENEGLVSYFCKKEFNREGKHFEYSEGFKKQAILKAA
jgi:hypothetical protein